MGMTPAERWTRLRGLMLAVAALNLITAMASSPAVADPLIMQGSTTFNRRVMEPLKR